MNVSVLLLTSALRDAPEKSSQLTWSLIARKANYRPQGIAGLCGVSFRTLQRHFRKHFQSTFTQWLEAHRMSEAYRRIAEGSSLKEVCFDLGYKQQSHFTRVFKKHFGIPPSFLSVSGKNFPAESPLQFKS